MDVCLAALCAQTYQPCEIILVDNGSHDGSATYVEQTFPQVRVIRLPENRGFCGGNNVGIRQARGTYIALINNDTEAEVDWLAQAIAALATQPTAGFAATRMRLFDQRTHLDSVGDYYFRTGYPAKRGWLLPDGAAYANNAWMFGACGGAVIYRKTLLDDVGLFDEAYFSYMEDVDLSFRAQLRGYRCLYVASAIMYHKVGATVATGSPRFQYWSHRNHWYTLIKNVPAGLWVRYISYILAAEALVLASAARSGRLPMFVQARSDVLRHMPYMLRQRRIIQHRNCVSETYLDSLIRNDWFSYRLAEKRRMVTR